MKARLCAFQHAAKQEPFLCVQQGVSSLCKAVEGNFLKMPFNSSSFDAAYAIEATCHADKVGLLLADHTCAWLHSQGWLALLGTPSSAIAELPEACISMREP